MPFGIAEFFREVIALGRLDRDLNGISKVLHWFRLQSLKTSVGKIDKCYPLSEFPFTVRRFISIFYGWS